jgi:hypothetical protein
MPVPSQLSRYATVSATCEAVGPHHLPAGEQVEELVVPAELDVGLDGDRVVGLHEWIEQLRDRDRLLRRIPLCEVISLQQPRDSGCPSQPQDLGEVQLREPLAVEPQLGTIRVDDRRRMLEITLRVRVDDLGCDDRPLGRPSRGIADPRRVVTDDQDAEVPLILERAHSLERDPVSERHVGRGDVDPQLDPQRPSERELALELSFRQNVGGIPGQLGEAHEASLEGRPG